MPLTPDQIDAMSDAELCEALFNDRPIQSWWPGVISTDAEWNVSVGGFTRRGSGVREFGGLIVPIVTQALQGWFLEHQAAFYVQKALGGLVVNDMGDSLSDSPLKAAVKAWLAVKGGGA